jgi:formate dehydrogenase major subunit/formate dehydrogenase alpha subunit
VILPAASFLEKEGTFTNTDRRVQRVRQILTPPGEARPDWWITQELGKRLAQALGRPWVLQLHPARGNPLRGIPPHTLLC